VPAADRHTPAELLAENDELARLLLLEVSGHRAPAMLRAFPALVDAAARMWSTLPTAIQGEVPGPDPMFRLVAIARGIDRAHTSGLWPADGPTDERLLIMATNFTRAAEMINNSVQAGHPNQASAVWGDLADGRTQTMHVLYVIAHGVTVGLAEHAAMITEQLRRDSLRKMPSSIRYDPGEPDAARAMISRLDVFEQIAGRYLFGSHGRRPNEVGGPSVSVTERLASVLAVWDIQAHRSLAAHPSPPNLACVSRVQALIATASAVIAEAAAHTGLIEASAYDRFASLIDRSQFGWTRAANRWSELINPAARTDPKLVGAAGEVRAYEQTSFATADLIASRIDLPTAAAQLQLASGAAVDVAYVARDIALTEPTLTAPARAIAMRTQADTERAIDHGESRYLGIDWVTAGDVRANRIIPLPDPARRGLVDTADHVIATAGQAAAAAATLTPPTQAERTERAQGGPASMPSRHAATRTPPIQSAERPGPSR
jgi:hypothetical protein